MLMSHPRFETHKRLGPQHGRLNDLLILLSQFTCQNAAATGSDRKLDHLQEPYALSLYDRNVLFPGCARRCKIIERASNLEASNAIDAAAPPTQAKLIAHHLCVPSSQQIHIANANLHEHANR